MKELFEKIESAQLNVSAIISADDRNHCNDLFGQYRFDVQFFGSIYTEMTKQLEAFKASPFYNYTDYSGPDYDIKRMTEELADLVQKRNKRLIREIENYFTGKYHLALKPYVYEPQRYVMEMFITYQPYIDQIIAQVGTDFTSTGQQQIKDDFQGLFFKGYREPKLQGSKISFTNMVQFNRYSSQSYLDYDCKGTIGLFTALGLFLHQATEMPRELADLFDGWKNKVIVGENYTTATGITFKLFGNRRMDVTFETKEQARQFWDFYNLHHIRQRDC